MTQARRLKRREAKRAASARRMFGTLTPERGARDDATIAAMFRATYGEPALVPVRVEE